MAKGVVPAKMPREVLEWEAMQQEGEGLGRKRSAEPLADAPSASAKARKTKPPTSPPTAYPESGYKLSKKRGGWQLTHPGISEAVLLPKVKDGIEYILYQDTHGVDIVWPKQKGGKPCYCQDVCMTFYQAPSAETAAQSSSAVKALPGMKAGSFAVPELPKPRKSTKALPKAIEEDVREDEEEPETEEYAHEFPVGPPSNHAGVNPEKNIKSIQPTCPS